MLSLATVLERFKKVHGTRYGYSDFTYKNRNTKGIIICDVHGPFAQTSENHYKGKGCPGCSRNRRLTTEVFIKNAKEVHGDRYDYSKVSFINAKTKVELICKEHGSFWQTSGTHINTRHGCLKCAQARTRKKYFQEPTTLYYIRFDSPQGPLYKIGITLTRIGAVSRYRKYKLPYEIVKQWEFKKGRGAYQMEQMILNDHAEFAYTGPGILRGGNSELFVKDILKLDTIGAS